MDHTSETLTRVVLPIPETPPTEHGTENLGWHRALHGNLDTRRIAFRRDGTDYFINDGTGREIRFGPGDWMLFNANGVHKVAPLAMADYPAAFAQGPVRLIGVSHGVATPEADIWNASFELDKPPQHFGTVWRLVPKAESIQPSNYAMGIVYVPIPEGSDPWQVTLWRVDATLAPVPGNDQASAQDRVIEAVQRYLDAQGGEPVHAAEAEYSSELIALAARDLVREVDASPAGVRPVGWDAPQRTGVTALLHYVSVTDFRRGLVANYETFKAAADKAVIEGRGDSAATMAAGATYTLAAVLGEAERRFGHDVATALAKVAENILMDGDSNDLNADVAPLPSAR